jgi:hypothetical protein
MTSRHEGCVIAMLTESVLSIAPRMRDFKRLVQRNGGCKTRSAAFRGVSVLTTCCALTLAHDASSDRRRKPDKLHESAALTEQHGHAACPQSDGVHAALYSLNASFLA